MRICIATFFLICCALSCRMDDFEFPKTQGQLTITGTWVGEVETVTVFDTHGNQFPATQLRIEKGPSLDRLKALAGDAGEKCSVVLLVKQRYPIGTRPLTRDEFPRGKTQSFEGSVFLDHPYVNGIQVGRPPAGVPPYLEIVLNISKLPKS